MINIADAGMALPRLRQVRRVVHLKVPREPERPVTLSIDPYVSLSAYLGDDSPSRLRSLVRAVELAATRVLRSKSARWTVAAARQLKDAIADLVASVRAWCGDHPQAVRTLLTLCGNLVAQIAGGYCPDGVSPDGYGRLAPLPAR